MTVYYENEIPNYLQKLHKSLKTKLKEKYSEPYPFERTFEDNPNAVGRQESDSQVSFTGLTEAFDQYRGRLLLLGEPGGGKTISLIKFAINKVEKRLDKPNLLLPIPIFAQIYTWTEIYNRQKKESKEEEIEYFIDWLVEQTKIDKEYLKQQITDKKVLLLLDGLDELPFNVSEKSQDPNATREDYRAKFIERLKSSEFEQVSMVVTCRSRDYGEITGNDDKKKLNLTGGVVLNRLSEQEIEQYVNLIFKKIDKKEDGIQLWKLLNRSPELLKMVRTPFLLDTLVSTYQNRDSDREGEKFSRVSTREQLFDRFIKQGFKREKEKIEERRKEELPCSSSEELKQELGAIAVVMMSDSEPDNNEIGEKIIKKVIPQKQRDSLTKLARNIQLLFETSKENVYCFRHLLLRDYLAFRYANDFLQNEEFQDNNSITKIEVVRALGKIDNLRAVKLLTGALNNKEEDKNVRYEAAYSLGQFSSGVYFRGYQQTFPEHSIISYSLREFSLNETKAYIEKSIPERPLRDLEIEKIHRFSRGIPLVVNLTATMWREGVPFNNIVAQGGDSHAQIIATTCERFLIHFNEFEYGKEDLRAVYILTMMRGFDAEFLQTILRTTDLQSRGQELYKRYSFVFPELSLNNQHQFFFKKYLLEKQCNSTLVNEISREARNYFENRFISSSGIRLTESLTTSAEQWIRKPENREIISNWVYYWFWESEDNGWNYLIPYLVEGWYYNLNWARSLLDIPAQFTSTRENKYLLELFQWGLPPSENLAPPMEDWSSLLDELEKRANQRLEDEEWIAIVLLKRGELLFEQGQYQEASDRYVKAKGFIPKEATALRNNLVSSLRRVEERIRREDDNKGILVETIKDLKKTLEEIIKKPTKETTEEIQAPQVSTPEITSPQPKNPAEGSDVSLEIKQDSIPFLGVIGLLLFILGFLAGVSISRNQNGLLWLFLGFLLGVLIGNDKIREAFNDLIKSLYEQFKKE